MRPFPHFPFLTHAHKTYDKLDPPGWSSFTSVDYKFSLSNGGVLQYKSIKDKSYKRYCTLPGELALSCNPSYLGG